MNVLIRADASKKIGTGHIMRCLTLANELKKQGEHAIFCSRHLTESLKNTILVSGHQLIRLENEDDSDSREVVDQYSSWLETSQNFDADEMLGKIELKQVDWVIVDHYALDSIWHHKIKDNNEHVKILVINDLFDKTHDCDLFLNQNIIFNENSVYENYLGSNVDKLLGPKYALLRDEFIRYRSKAEIRTYGVKNVLVFFGGIDINNTTGKTLSALTKIDDQRLSVEAVIGAAHPRIDDLRDQCKSQGFNLNVQVDNMAELMCWADLSIGASGSASWERCCLGLPSIIISLADNQIAIAEAAESTGIMNYLGKDEELTQFDIATAVTALCESTDELARMSATCFAYVDGSGKQRVIEKMRALS